MTKKKKIIVIISTIAFVTICLVIFYIISNKDNVTKVQKGCKYIIKYSGKELTEGERLPRKPEQGDIYVTEDYLYIYYDGVYHDDPYSDIGLEEDEELKGWHHRVTKHKESYEEIATKIAGEPVVNVSFWGAAKMIKSPKIPKYVVNMYNAFYGCTSLKEAPKLPKNLEIMEAMFVDCVSLENAPVIPSKVTDLSAVFNNCISLKKAPVIPEGVTNMRSTFVGCKNLQEAPVIPKNVKNMNHTFMGCISLSGTIEINANPDEYEKCFADIDFEKQNITLSGSSDMLEKLKTQNTGY